MANSRHPFPQTMIGPSASFYDPDQHQQQQWADYPQQFDFAYPAPGATFDELVAQYIPQPQQQQQHYHHPAQHQAQQHALGGRTFRPKRKRTAKKAAPAPEPAAASYSDNSDSEDGFGGFGGGAGISVGMGGLGVRSKGARL
ncbi:hypothetical protein B0H19DRAFT_1261796 [Mycena capillaripes]|nr:hypothetical protein B0H19DRAFT_1261796 [Mycena capillaripes]